MENTTSFDIKVLLDLSPPVALMFSLNLIFLFLKRSPRIPNDIIPWISPLLGMFVYPWITEPGKVAFAVRSPLAAQMVTGFLVGLAAVGANQWFKTFYKKVGLFSGDTGFIDKTTTTTTTTVKTEKGQKPKDDSVDTSGAVATILGSSHCADGDCSAGDGGSNH